MERLSLRVSLILCCLGLIFLSQSLRAQEFGKVDDWEWIIGAPPEIPDAPAVILFSRAYIGVTTEMIKTEFFTRIKILTDDGAQAIGTISESYNDALEKCKKFEARTIFPDGTVKKVQRNAVEKKQDGEIITFSFTFPEIQPGCIVEYKYIIQSKNFYHLRPWYFQSELYTYKSQYAFSLQPGFTYWSSFLNIPPDKYEPVTRDIPDMSKSLGMQDIRVFSWEMENLPPIDDEPYMTCRNDYRSSIHCQLQSYKDPYGGLRTFVKEWSDVGREFAEFFDAYCDDDPAIQRIADSLTAGISDLRGKSRALFRFVAGAIALYDIPGRWFAPEKMSLLLEAGSGTREAKNLLLVRLHKTAGIAAWPVLVSTRANGQIYDKFASSQQFNTMIALVEIGGRREFLDASGPHAPYGILTPQCLSKQVLLLDGTASKIIPLNRPQVTSYRTDQSVLHITASGAASGRTRSEFGGFFASEYADQCDYLSPDDFTSIFYLEQIGPDAARQRANCELDSADHFIVDVDYAIEKAILQGDSISLIAPINLYFRNNPFTSEKRFFPVDFAYPFVYTNRNEFILDNQELSLAGPTNTTEQINGASFVRNCETTDSSLIISTTLRIDTPVIQPQQYQDLRSFFETYTRVANEPLEVVAKK